MVKEPTYPAHYGSGTLPASEWQAPAPLPPPGEWNEETAATVARLQQEAETGVPQELPDVQVHVKGDKASFINPDSGEQVWISVDKADEAARVGFIPENTEAYTERLSDKYYKEATTEAFADRAFGGLTFGFSDLAGGKYDRRHSARLAREHPTAATAGSVVGTAASMLYGGAIGRGAGAVGAVAGRVAGRAARATAQRLARAATAVKAAEAARAGFAPAVAARAGRMAGSAVMRRVPAVVGVVEKAPEWIAREAAIGAAIGGGHSVSSQSLGSKPFSWDQLAEDAGTGALYGIGLAGAGAAISGTASRTGAWLVTKRAEKFLKKAGTNTRAWGKWHQDLKASNDAMQAVKARAEVLGRRSANAWSKLETAWAETEGQAIGSRIRNITRTVDANGRTIQPLADLSQELHGVRNLSFIRTIEDNFKTIHQTSANIAKVNRAISGDVLTSSLAEQLMRTVVFGGAGYYVTDSPYGFAFALVPNFASKRALKLLKPKGGRAVGGRPAPSEPRIVHMMDSVSRAYGGVDGKFLRRFTTAGATHAAIHQYSEEDTAEALADLEGFDSKQWEKDIITSAMDQGRPAIMASAIGRYHKGIIDIMLESAGKGSADFSRTMNILENPFGFVNRVKDGTVSLADMDVLKRVDPQAYDRIINWARTALDQSGPNVPPKLRRMLEILAGQQNKTTRIIQEAAYGGQEQEQKKEPTKGRLNPEIAPTAIQGLQKGIGA